MSDGYDTDDGALAFWQPVDDLAAELLAGGLVALGSSADATVRVRNTATDYIAAAVLVAVTAPLTGIGSTADGSGQILVSADGTGFAATCELGDLGPGAVSAPITVRRVTAAGTAAGPHGYRLTATARTWTPAAPALTGGTDPDDPDAYDPQAAPDPVDDPQEQML